MVKSNITTQASSNKMVISQANRILELDALRGFAAIIVVLYHFSMISRGKKYGLGLGTAGVDLFFIISGFVILLTLEKTVRAKDFIVSRFSRLFPAYWFCLTFTTLLIIARGHYLQIPTELSITDYLANLTMVQRYFYVQDIDGPYWTLFVEIIFYAFMLFIFQIGKVKKIESIGCLCLLPILFYHFYLKIKFPHIYKITSTNIELVNYFPLFFMGILFYKIKFYGPSFSKYLMVAICTYIQMLLFDRLSNSVIITFNRHDCMLLLFIGLFILYLSDYLGFIVNRITLFLGSISYSLYLIHQYISLRIIIPYIQTHFDINFWVAALLINLPIVLLLASFITYYIEKPSMNYIRKNYLKKNRASSVTVS